MHKAEPYAPGVNNGEGHIIPGARVKATYNLIERGLAWTPGITETKEFIDVVCEIRAVFPSL